MQSGAHFLVVTHREDGLKLFQIQLIENDPYNCSAGEDPHRHACVEQVTNYCPRLIAIISGIYWLVIIVGLIHMSKANFRNRSHVIASASQIELQEKT